MAGASGVDSAMTSFSTSLRSADTFIPTNISWSVMHLASLSNICIIYLHFSRAVTIVALINALMRS